MDWAELIAQVRDFLSTAVPTIARWLSRYWPIIPVLVVLRLLIGLLGNGKRRRRSRRNNSYDNTSHDSDSSDSGSDSSGGGE